jgi:porin
VWRAAARGARVLDDLLLNADVDLAAGLGWKGASGHISFLNNFGGQPNTLAGTLQGIDNIEVTSPRPKIYEAWVDQALGGGGSDLRVGLYDADVEFNVTDSAALFLQPTYGTSSEFAATGPNGPSIFPSTALAARLNLQPRQDVYVHLAVIDAQAGTLGDPGGVDTHFAKGLLLIAESGWTGSGKVAVGIWTYTRRQPDVDAPPPPAVAPRSYSRGIYLMVDEPFIRTAWGAQASVFVRGGLSDGETTPYRTAGSMGVLLSHVIPVRPDSALGVGFAWGGLSAKYRADSEATGTPLAEAETALEVTYADKVGQYLTFQPDLQFIHRPSGNPMIRDALVLGLRTSTSF